MIEELKVPAPDSQPLHFPTEYAVSRGAQLRTILWKNSCVYWRYTGALPYFRPPPVCLPRKPVSTVGPALCLSFVFRIGARV